MGKHHYSIIIKSDRIGFLLNTLLCCVVLGLAINWNKIGTMNALTLVIDA